MKYAHCQTAFHVDCHSPDCDCYCHREEKGKSANEIIRSSPNPWLGKNRADYIVALLSNVDLKGQYPLDVAGAVVQVVNRIIELTEGS